MRNLLSSIVIGALLFPSLLYAEGAVRILDCIVKKNCDAAGDCKPVSQTVEFRMTPVKLNPDGSGEYQLSYNDSKSPMTASTAAGPFLWSLGNERDTLLASSTTQFLWHRLMLEPAPNALLLFLECVVRQ